MWVLTQKLDAELDSQALNDRTIIPEYYPSRILGGEKAGLRCLTWD